MMTTDEYTPTTAQVRAMYADGEIDGSEQDYAEFDCCLQKVKAEAWEEGATAVEQGFIDRNDVINPYL